MSHQSDIPKRALVADDDQDICAQWKEALESDGWEVVSANDGVAAEQALESFCPNVAVLDLRMPRKEGNEVLRVIHDRFPWTKAIIVTGKGKESDPEESCNLGAFRYLKKVVSPSKLVDCCNEALQAVPPALWAFSSWFRRLPDREKVVFQTASGKQMTAAQLMEEIRRQTSEGQGFLRQIEGVAVELIAKRL